MEISIRMYQKTDRRDFVKLMEGLQDYLVSIDNLKRLRRMPDYGESYTERTLQNVAKNNGVIYVAETEGRTVGLIVGTILDLNREELLECVPFKRGVVMELIVQGEYRKKGVGTMLMEKMEGYFRQNSCNVSRVEVFFPNKNAYKLYSKMGYSEREIWMSKNL